MDKIFLVIEHYDNGAIYREDSISWKNVICAFSTRKKAMDYISAMPVPENNEDDEDEKFFEVKKGEVMYKYVHDYYGNVRAFIRKSCYWDGIYDALSYYVKEVPFE